MSKIYFSLFVVLFSLSFYSCMSDDDDDIDYEWKDYQTKIYDDISVLSDDSGNRIYNPLKSESSNGSVYWKTSDYITNRMAGDFSQKRPETYLPTKSSPARPSAITDSVVVRYEGWYYDRAGDFKRFAGTEFTGSTTETKPPYVGTDNTQTEGFGVAGLIDGFRTTLMNMVVNEERIVCIPANMGYGATAQTSIPAYTTLFFDIKLLKIYSGDGTLIADGTIKE